MKRVIKFLSASFLYMTAMKESLGQDQRKILAYCEDFGF